MTRLEIAIVDGSPHEDGYTCQLVARVASGVESIGLSADIIHLREYDIQPCMNTPGWPCWPDKNCHRVEDDTALIKEKIQTAAGLAIACPVYWSSINGLTKNFLDKMRLSGFEGKPSLAITMAGGSGNGLVLAIKSLHGFFGWGYRPLAPLPVSRFNFEHALGEAFERGQQLAKAASTDPRPFGSEAEQWRWERQLPFADWQLLDEKLFLAGLIVEHARQVEGEDEMILKKAKKRLLEAKSALAASQEDLACDLIEEAYRLGRSLWN